jgi:hypothetical protein
MVLTAGKLEQKFKEENVHPDVIKKLKLKGFFNNVEKGLKNAQRKIENEQHNYEPKQKRFSQKEEFDKQEHKKMLGENGGILRLGGKLHMTHSKKNSYKPKIGHLRQKHYLPEKVIKRRDDEKEEHKRRKMSDKQKRYIDALKKYAKDHDITYKEAMIEYNNK